MTGIVVAMQGEFDNILLNLLEKVQKVHSNKYKQYTGYFGNNKVIVIISGVGKVRAASATQYLIDNYQPKQIINIGVCGATKGLKSVTTIGKVIEDDYDTSIFDNGIMEKNYVKLDGEGTLYTADHITTESTVEGYFDMEGYAVAKVCKTNKIYCKLIKSVTDYISSEEQSDQYETNYEIACKRAKDILMEYLQVTA